MAGQGMPPNAPQPELANLLGELLGCDPSTISADGFTMTALQHGAVVHATLVKRISREDAVRLGEALAAAYDRQGR